MQTAETLDTQDQEIVDGRMAALDEVPGPRVGDWVDFTDGTSRRISYQWPDGGNQTSDGGSYYLGRGYVSMSGGLHPSIYRPLEPTGETRPGSVWIFHHDHREAHNGVDFMVPFRVYHSDEEPPR